MKTQARAAVLLLAIALSACSSGMNAIIQTAQNIVQRDRDVERARLNPEFRYLRVTIDGRAALIALGDVDSDPRGAIEVWYSAEREVLRIQNGRVVGAVGLTTEWRSVSLPALPSWSNLAREQGTVRWPRVRDVMTGYKFGLRDELALRVVSPPQKSALQNLDPQRLTWFEERAEQAHLAGSLEGFRSGRPADLALPPARYALDFRDGKETVVYGEQCLAPKLCFTWQRWPVESQGSFGK